MGKSGTLIIYNLTGQSVKTLYQGNFNAGLSKFQWNGRDQLGKPVSTGTYIYRLVIDGFSQSQKMVLLK
jgi:flagellar hook assembly protein FlgD